MTASDIITLTNDDPRFYPMVGPFLGSRAVHTWLGGPLWDDDGRTWLVAAGPSGQAAGFVAVATSGGMAVVESCYTDGDEKLARRLIRAAVASVAPSPCRATVRRDHAAAYLAEGFVEAGATVNFVKLVRKGS